MHELERTIAAILRPEPSPALDERIGGLLAASHCVRPPRSRRSGALTLLTTAVCVGAICFYWGRQSKLATVDSADARIRTPAKDRPPRSISEAGNVVRIPLREDQLAGLFVQPTDGEGLLGKGPVTVEVFASP